MSDLKTLLAETKRICEAADGVAMVRVFPNLIAALELAIEQRIHWATIAEPVFYRNCTSQVYDDDQLARVFSGGEPYPTDGVNSKYNTNAELIAAVRAYQASEAKLLAALEAIETGDQSLGGKYGTAKELRHIAREAIAEHEKGGTK